MASAFETIKCSFSGCVKESAAWTLKGLLGNVEAYIKAHPKATIVQVFSIMVMVCPWLVTMPGLAALGFGYLGPSARKLIPYLLVVKAC